MKMKTKIMGVLNITPDSFSDGGLFSQANSDKVFKPDIDKVLYRAKTMIEDGAEVLDIGGESTRPDGASVSSQEEIERVVPVIEAIKKNFDIELSVDTYKAKTAELSVNAGADIVNDIGFMELDPDMGSTVAKLGVKYILMHNVAPEDITSKDKNIINPVLVSSSVRTSDKESYVNQYIMEIKDGIKRAENVGILAKNLILDPGIGFNKSYEQNLMIMGELRRLCKLGYPVLLGVSRKTVIGNTLDLPVNERLEGTIATSVLAAMEGVEYLRVHDVKENYRAVKMALKLKEYGA